jgi:hypothetical protein
MTDIPDDTAMDAEQFMADLDHIKFCDPCQAAVREHFRSLIDLARIDDEYAQLCGDAA